VLAKGIPDAELVIFENSSHMAFIEEREPYIPGGQPLSRSAPG
jgi:pimeloyl-ACP methyl ester carboxylesterase